jgi:hypothetical protein
MQKPKTLVDPPETVIVAANEHNTGSPVLNRAVFPPAHVSKKLNANKVEVTASAEKKVQKQLSVTPLTAVKQDKTKHRMLPVSVDPGLLFFFLDLFLTGGVFDMESFLITMLVTAVVVAIVFLLLA